MVEKFVPSLSSPDIEPDGAPGGDDAEVGPLRVGVDGREVAGQPHRPSLLAALLLHGVPLAVLGGLVGEDGGGDGRQGQRRLEEQRHVAAGSVINATPKFPW